VTPSRRLRWTAGALAVGALAVSQLVAGTSAVAAGAAARPALHGGSGMTPAIGVQPPHHKAGTVTPGLRPNYPLIFNCQKRNAPLTCYSPDQMRTAYGFDTLINAGFTGRGRTIVIVDAFSDPALRRDLRIFDEVFGLPNANLTVVAPDGETPFDINDPNQVGWSGEIALDVEWSHAMAPGAKIVLVEAKTNNDNDLASALQYVADNNLGDVVSQSFGEAESCLGVNADGTHQPGVTLAAAHRIYTQMADEGITVFASAGDDGSAQPTCDGSGEKLAASTPASDPAVTGVGGTQLFADPRSGVYDHEVVWNEGRTFGAAGGGGFSSYFDQPSFQRGLGDFPGRGVPDIAYDAAINHGVLVAYSVQDPPGTFYIFGGTSAGSPQWAALAAISDQLNHGRLGNINRSLYRLSASDFHDVTRGNNAFDGVPGYTASQGWDPTTGLGSPYAGRVALGLAASG
jgi:subtilase family serine protease